MRTLDIASLDIPITVSPTFSNAYVDIQPVSVTFSIPLQDTTGMVITSAPIQVGVVTGLNSAPLIATFSMWYAYDSSILALTVCTDNFVSADAPYITTYPQGYDEACNQHTYSGDDSPCNNNPNWNYCTNAAGLQQLLQSTARAANDAIFQAALAAGVNVITRSPLPPVPPELYKKLRAVYHKGKFIGMYDETKTYNEEYSILNLDSIWFGEIYLSNGEQFANVIGSTNDPKIDRESWIGLWRSQFGATGLCTSYNNAGTPGGALGPFTCTPSGKLFGGHVVLGEYSENVLPGSNKVFIIPICPAHNNNDNVYMAALNCTQGIAIHNYLN